MGVALPEKMVLEALAFADALWTPMRDPLADYWAAVSVLRRRYPERGLPWRGGGDKDAERALTLAVKNGWLTRRRAARKTIGARMTRAGLVEAWRLIGVGPFDDVIVLDEVLRHAPAGAWVPETAMNDGKGWGDGQSKSLRLVEIVNQPALTSGLVESGCLLHGQVCYRAVPGVERPAAPDDDASWEAPEPDPEAEEVYSSALAENLNWLDSQTNVSVDARGEIGMLHLAPWQLTAFVEAGGHLPGTKFVTTYRDGTPLPKHLLTRPTHSTNGRHHA